jgi:hypothetical protein
MLFDIDINGGDSGDSVTLISKQELSKMKSIDEVYPEAGSERLRLMRRIR